jgi:hypothetical protein
MDDVPEAGLLRHPGTGDGRRHKYAAYVLESAFLFLIAWLRGRSSITMVGQEGDFSKPLEHFYLTRLPASPCPSSTG